MDIPTAFNIAFVLWAAASLAFATFGLWQWHRDQRDREARWVLANPILRSNVHVSPSPLLAPVPVEQDWDAKAAAYARYVADFAALVERRAHRLHTDTVQYVIYVEQEFGVALREVGPRELDCTRTEGWTQPTFEFGVVTR